MEVSATLAQNQWQLQQLPAPLIPAELALVVTLSLLRQQPATVGAVSAGNELVLSTLHAAGIDCSRLLLVGPGLEGIPSVCYQTDEPGVALFDELLAGALQQPGTGVPDSATWLRERTLAVEQLRATSPAGSFFTLPEVDNRWLQQDSGEIALAPEPRFWRTWLLGLLLLAGFLGLLDAYLFTAGPNFSIWLLPALPLIGSLAFGALLLRQLRQWRQRVALAWLARPARLRPDSERVARELTRAPWHLLWLPPLLLLLAFGVIILNLGNGARPTLGVLLGPLFFSLLIQAGLAAYQGWRTMRQTHALISGLPAGLVPSSATTGPLWQLYRYY